MQENIPLNVAMVRIKFELKQKIKEIRQTIPVPSYIINAVLSDIQSELKEEEKETLTIMLMQEQAKQVQKEERKDDANADV